MLLASSACGYLVVSRLAEGLFVFQLEHDQVFARTERGCFGNAVMDGVEGAARTPDVVVGAVVERVFFSWDAAYGAGCEGHAVLVSLETVEWLFGLLYLLRLHLR